MRAVSDPQHGGTSSGDLMQTRRLRLGDVVDDYCPRERRLSNHVVVAMVGDAIKQTRCTTCDFEHPYKDAKMPARRKKKDSTAALYQQVLEGMTDRPPAVGVGVVAAEAPAIEPVVPEPTRPKPRMRGAVRTNGVARGSKAGRSVDEPAIAPPPPAPPASVSAPLPTTPTTRKKTKTAAAAAAAAAAATPAPAPPAPAMTKPVVPAVAHAPAIAHAPAPAPAAVSSPVPAPAPALVHTAVPASTTAQPRLAMPVRHAHAAAAAAASAAAPAPSAPPVSAQPASVPLGNASTDADEETGAPAPGNENEPLHRRTLIRATLPRPAGEVPTRQAPTFTMREAARAPKFRRPFARPARPQGGPGGGNLGNHGNQMGQMIGRPGGGPPRKKNAAPQHRSGQGQGNPQKGRPGNKRFK
jgi:hypothetical protein